MHYASFHYVLQIGVLCTVPGVALPVACVLGLLLVGWAHMGHSPGVSANLYKSGHALWIFW